MKTKAHYFHDYLGGWDFEYGDEVDIPEEVIKAYKKAEEKYIKACDAVRDSIAAVKR